MFCCVNGTIQMTEGRGYFARRPHFGHHCVRDKKKKSTVFFCAEEVATMCKQQNSLLALFSVLLVHR